MFRKIKFKKLLMFAPLMTLMFCFNSPQNDDEKMQAIMLTPVSYTHLDVYKRQSNE